MKSLKVLAAGLAALSVVGTAQAGDNGHSYAAVGVDSYEFDAYGISAKLGYMFTENFGIEAQGGIGLIDDEIESPLGDIDVGVDNSFAGFVRAAAPLSDDFTIFARGGYHATQFSVEGPGVDAQLETDGLAFGAGLEYSVNQKGAIRAEYTNLDVDDVDASADVFSLSYVAKF